MNRPLCSELRRRPVLVRLVAHFGPCQRDAETLLLVSALRGPRAPVIYPANGVLKVLADEQCLERQ